MNVKFTSCFLDYSGYGQASRNMLQAMIKVGINVTVEIVSFQEKVNKINKSEEWIKRLENRKLDYNIKIIMLTPEQAIFMRERDKYNIEILFWEVLGIDKQWVSDMNKMNEIWCPSRIFADTFKNSGVSVPIKIIRQPIKIKEDKFVPFKIKKFKSFLFYSIFEWTERKNPKMLLNTYWKTFEDKKDVALLLKVYQGDFLENKKEIIRNDIRKWKKELNLQNYPKIFLVLGELNTKNIMRLHATGDCFISSHRGEGWGYPQMEAMSVGNPIISTNFGGIHELLSNKNSWLVRYGLINVFGMDHIQWYNSSQLWANPNDVDLAFSMQEAYSNRELVIQKGKSARNLIQNKLSLKVVGGDVLKKLEVIK